MEEDAGHDLMRAPVLALFVSDCFGGCDRSASLGRTLRAIVSLRKEQPFVCTCSAGNLGDNNEASKQTNTLSGHFDFTGLCNRSIHLIKERRNSGIVPIGSLQIGVCRHRAVLMKVVTLFPVPASVLYCTLTFCICTLKFEHCNHMLCSICVTGRTLQFLVSL